MIALVILIALFAIPGVIVVSTALTDFSHWIGQKRRDRIRRRSSFRRGLVRR